MPTDTGSVPVGNQVFAPELVKALHELTDQIQELRELLEEKIND